MAGCLFVLGVPKALAVVCGPTDVFIGYIQGTNIGVIGCGNYGTVCGGYWSSGIHYTEKCALSCACLYF